MDVLLESQPSGLGPERDATLQSRREEPDERAAQYLQNPRVRLASDAAAHKNRLKSTDSFGKKFLHRSVPCSIDTAEASTGVLYRSQPSLKPRYSEWFNVPADTEPDQLPGVVCQGAGVEGHVPPGYTDACYFYPASQFPALEHQDSADLGSDYDPDDWLDEAECDEEVKKITGEEEEEDEEDAAPTLSDYALEEEHHPSPSSIAPPQGLLTLPQPPAHPPTQRTPVPRSEPSEQGHTSDNGQLSIASCHIVNESSDPRPSGTVLLSTDAAKSGSVSPIPTTLDVLVISRNSTTQRRTSTAADSESAMSRATPKDSD